MLGQETRHHAADVGRMKTFALELDVLAIEQGGDDRRIGRRTADAVFFERLDQRGFAVTRRRFGEMLFQANLQQVDVVAFLHRR